MAAKKETATSRKTAETVKTSDPVKTAEPAKAVEPAKKETEVSVKTTEKKTEAPVKAAAEKKETPAKKEPVKKEAAKKAPAKKAVKEEPSRNVYIQFAGKEVSGTALMELVTEKWTAQGHRASSVKSLEVYVKPDDMAAYYVINGKETGKIEL